MREINLQEKTGFKVMNPAAPIVIRDYRGLMFYDTTPVAPRVKYFNLPAGKYTVESGDFKPMNSPVKYQEPSLPPIPERELDDPTGFKFLWGDNKNKCTINFKEKWIWFDNSLKEYTLPEFYFILFHEYGHQYFKSEHLADLVSTVYMLRKGFNPEQIGRAHITSLSCRQHARKRFNVEQLMKTMNDFQIDNFEGDYFEGEYYADKAGFPADAIGKFGVSKKPITFYVSPGGEAYKTRPLTKWGYATTSKISALNSTKTWAKFNDVTSGKDLWVPYAPNPDMKFYVNFNQELGKEVPPSTPAEIEAAKRMGVSIAAGAAVPGGSQVVAAGYKIADVASEVGDSIGKGFDFLTGSLKWLIIGSIIVVLIVLFITLRNSTK